MTLNTIQGDLLTCQDPVIVHQTNCVTTRGAGLAHLIFNKYPYSDVYKIRKSKPGNKFAFKEACDTPGTIKTRSPPVVHVESVGESSIGTSGPVVVNLFGQYNIGGPKKDNYQREGWFKSGLDELREFMVKDGYKSCAFPYKIGCGLGGGKWKNYEKMIKEFAKDVPFDVNIIRRECD